MSTVCCPPAPLVLRRPPMQRGLAVLRQVWAAWRADSEQRALLRALEELSDRTRRDIGLAESAPLAASRTLWDVERGMW